MKKDEIWKECRYKDCETQILGYCVKCSMREFSNLIPVVNPDPDEEFLHWAMIDGELTPLVSKEK